MNKSTSIVVILGAILLLIFLIGVGPALSIWSINTLFFTSIPFNIWTWLAMCWIQVSTIGSITGVLTQIKNKL